MIQAHLQSMKRKRIMHVKITGHETASVKVIATLILKNIVKFLLMSIKRVLF